ncbi:replicative DNA helicase [Stenotrophomonas sp. ATCM1_4]|uniref:replicative DNA helicase n=1 Tax=Stenotrophomonas sp. ATCM1_4 TaxID=2259330 RepID=UPI001052580D|nr:replicative DNA helicase [Stenotrophomonas sp. ATCM1_4]TDB28424.1 replicative DNA helicase [Stenotrophomonas sp. ATCM1_4]
MFDADATVAQMRVPPQSVAAEQAVIGGLLLYPEAWRKIEGSLEPADFYRRDHQLIFTAIRDMVERDRPFDAVTLGEWFQAQGMGEQVPDHYLTTLASTTPSAANIAGYAKVVSDKALARRMVSIGTEIADAAYDPRFEPEEGIAAAQVLMQGLAPSHTGGLVAVTDTLPAWFDDLRYRFELGTSITGVPTPWKDLNDATHGLQPGELIILAGRPSMGKSIAGLNIADFAAVDRHVALFSLEMSKNQLNRRGISAAAKVPHEWLLAPGGSDEYWAKVTAAVRDRRALNLSVDDTPALRISQLMARARALHARRPIELLVVDHIHDFKIDAKLARFEYGEIAQGLKTLAKEFNCPVLALGQLNRALSNRQDKRPNMSDLRESGEIEQKADMIIFIHRDDYYDKTTHMRGIVELILAKGRDVEAGKSIFLRNDYAHMALRDREGDLPEAPEPDRPAPRAGGKNKFFGGGRRGGFGDQD